MVALLHRSNDEELVEMSAPVEWTPVPYQHNRAGQLPLILTHMHAHARGIPLPPTPTSGSTAAAPTADSSPSASERTLPLNAQQHPSMETSGELGGPGAPASRAEGDEQAAEQQRAEPIEVDANVAAACEQLVDQVIAAIDDYCRMQSDAAHRVSAFDVIE